MKKIFYWSPYLTNVATIKAVINSIKSMKKYSKDYEPILINSCGEFDKYKKDLFKLNIKVIDLVFFNYHKFLPTKGFIKSRFSFLIIFIVSFLPLLLLIKSKKPDYFIFHLITSLPITILNILKIDTKFILRISGLPKYNGFRKLFWKKLGKKIYRVTCPTIGTMLDLKSNKIFEENKIVLLRDPIVSVRKISRLKDEKNEYNYDHKNYLIVAIGRLTKQKNFMLLINCFQKIIKIKKNAKLLIIGEGEQKNNLQNIIEKKKLLEKVILVGFKENVYSYLKNANLFILSSLWEDPGWVLIEAAASNTLLLASNCKNGPEELIEKNQGGVLFENNSYEDFIEKFKHVTELNHKQIYEKKVFSKKKIKQFTIFNHYLHFKKILS
jgi:glycosyltransferase involved in cell wall biosynthesis